MSRWLKKQEEMVKEEAQSLGIAVMEPESGDKPKKWKHGDFHTWKRGDSLHDVAYDMHVTIERLREYNEIESYSELEAGIPIYFPSPTPDKSRRITVDILPEPREMHISKLGGTKKWAFGNMHTWDDAQPTGFFPENTNVKIVAIAHVPIEDKENPEAEAAYYLEYAAIGDYATTGRLKYTMGYAWSDLEDGHVDSIVVQTRPAQEAIDEKEAEPEPEPKEVAQPRVPKFLEGFDPWFIEQRLEDYKRDGSMHRFTETYQRLEVPIPCAVMLPEDDPSIGEIDGTTGLRFIWIRDFAMKRPNRKLFQNQEVVVAATFEYDGELYGRPVKSVENQNFFGVPMSLMQSEADLFVYNKPVDAAMRRQHGGHLTWSERYIWIPTSKMLARFTPGYMKKIEKTKIKKG